MSTDGRKARVLRPVQRSAYSSYTAPATNIRTNKVLPQVSQMQFAKNAMLLIQKLRRVMYDSKELSSTQQTVEAVREGEKIYEQLELYAKSVCNKANDNPSALAFYNMMFLDWRSSRCFNFVQRGCRQNESGRVFDEFRNC
ncbi:unnamed protein product [Auanema sp. JU1783]|nr:unnamed protein product [Auanema sp. JU1783]